MLNSFETLLQGYRCPKVRRHNSPFGVALELTYAG